MFSHENCPKLGRYQRKLWAGLQPLLFYRLVHRRALSRAHSMHVKLYAITLGRVFNSLNTCRIEIIYIILASRWLLRYLRPLLDYSVFIETVVLRHMVEIGFQLTIRLDPSLYTCGMRIEWRESLARSICVAVKISARFATRKQFKQSLRELCGFVNWVCNFQCCWALLG